MRVTDDLRRLVPRVDEMVARIHGEGVERALAFVRQPSVSLMNPRPIPESIMKMVGLIGNSLLMDDRSDCDKWMCETGTYPVVRASFLASRDHGDKPTILLYQMGDTRPYADQKGWLIENPVEPQLVEVDGEMRWLGRGIFNSKGSLAGMIDVIRMLVEMDELPVNLEVIVDFEEEVRPDSLMEVLRRQHDQFARCSVALMPMMTESFGIIPLGFKGVAVAKVTLKENRPQVHSGQEALLLRPTLMANAAALIERLHQGDKVTEAAWATVSHERGSPDYQFAVDLSERMRLGEFARSRGITDTSWLYRTNSLLQLVLDEDRFHVNVLGVHTEHSEGIVPQRAKLLLEFRLPREVGESPQQVDEMVERHIREAGKQALFGDCVEIEKIEMVPGTGLGCKTPVDHPMVEMTRGSYQIFESDQPIAPVLGGSVPEGGIIQREFDIPFMACGLGRAGAPHAPNEWMADGAYERFKLWFVSWLHMAAGLPKK